ncbi:unnamed protein product [Rotaria sp. Silwood1]|nr:unnamed protein product [Rotaria sp. Silwood1]CAF3480009.1 unnamed protein product [Rotaria sp. Silwood1]CAF3485218.1 unnamed protein product [Rotaria sp. Silwood1]CAF4839692.1 unnamed protein product [Rotaria sp. Silwood1]CAF4923492.1 unnamed protein product [Rotaria sp. Silwood1]
MPTSSQRSVALHVQPILFTEAVTSCVSPYVRASSGNCVNSLLDFNNCGAAGTVCASTDTSCSAGACSSTIPAVQLVSYTSIWTGGVNGSADDEIFNVTLPFSITVYNTTTNYIQITTNGVICLSDCSDTWQETDLHTNSFGAAVLPYWDDLYIYAKTWQGIYYASQGSAPNRILVFEYYMSHYGSPNEYYRFQVEFSEATSGIIEFTYFEAYDTGASSTVGVQGVDSGQYIRHSFHTGGSVTSNMVLTFDTNAGTYTSSTIG